MSQKHACLPVLIVGCLLAVCAAAPAQEALTQLDLDNLIRQIQICWKLPPDVSKGRTSVVEVRIKFKSDGTLDGRPKILNEPTGDDLILIIDSAIRALVRCQPFKLRVASYESWKEIDVTFNSSVQR